MAISIWRTIRIVTNRYPFSVHLHRHTRLATTQEIPNKLANDEPLQLVIEKLKQNIDPIQAVNILNDVVTTNATQRHNLIKNPGFKNLETVLGKTCPSLNNGTLINSLKNMLTVNIQPESYVLQSLETEILWRMRKLSHRHLINLLNFHVEYQRTELETKVVRDAVQVIQRRWVEIDNIRDAADLFAMKESFTREFLAKLEDRTIEAIENSSFDEMRKLVSVLAKVKHRPLSVLRSLAFHLAKRSEKLSVKHAVGILAAVNELKFPDHVLLSRLTADLVVGVPEIEKASVVSAVLTCVGQLKWKNIELLDSLTDWISLHMDKCQPQHLASYVITVGTLNYMPYNTAIYDNIVNELNEKSISIPSVWLDVVFSLAIHKRASEDHLKSVLTLEFVEKITTPSGKTKLAILNNVAKYEHPNYNGPYANVKDLLMGQPKEVHQSNSLVIETLSNFLPRGRFMTNNKVVLNCIFIEAEFLVDSKAKPVPLSNYSSVMDKNRSLPAEINKMALQVRHFKDYTINVEELTGGNVLCKRLLEKLNYKVVEVPYAELSILNTTLKKVQYLQKLIAKSISKDEAI